MSKPTLAYYIFGAVGPGVAGGGTDIFCASLQRFFQAQGDRIQLMVIPVAPSQVFSRNRIERFGRFLVKLINDYTVWYTNRANLQVLVYPKLPVTALTDKPLLLHMTRWVWQAWARSARRRGQQIVIIVEDLPAEQGFSVDIPPAALQPTPANCLEHTVFRAANTLVVPSQRFASYIVQKHGVSSARIELFRRNIYMPPVAKTPPAPVKVENGVNVLYSGRLDPRMESIFRQVLAVFARYATGTLWICGHGREWVETWLASEQIPNVHHLGVLDHSAHDALARQCDFGLLLYPRSFYNDMTPTMKYTGYAANGLAILSTDLATVRENIQEDGIGKALPLSELLTELEAWLVEPSLFASLKQQAETLAVTFRRGVYMQEWFDQVIEPERE